MNIDPAAIKLAIPLLARCGQLGIILDSSGCAPCPKGCSPGHRRAFYVTRHDFWACRYCHEEHGDVIELERWLKDCSFVEALKSLSDGNILPKVVSSLSTPRRPQERKPSKNWEVDPIALVGRSTTALHCEPEAEAHRQYLASRGLPLEVARLYSVGAVRSRFGQGISLPHLSGRVIHSIKVRMLAPRDNSERFRFEPGSVPWIFGGNLLFRTRTLIATEGEFNALAIAAAIGMKAPADAISFGAETKWDLLVDVIPRYERVLVWLDNPEKAKQAASKLEHNHLVVVASPGGRDANDILRMPNGPRLLKGLIEAKLGVSLDEVVPQPIKFEFDFE